MCGYNQSMRSTWLDIDPYWFVYVVVTELDIVEVGKLAPKIKANIQLSGSNDLGQ